MKDKEHSVKATSITWHHHVDTNANNKSPKMMRCTPDAELLFVGISLSLNINLICIKRYPAQSVNSEQITTAVVPWSVVFVAMRYVFLSLFSSWLRTRRKFYHASAL